MVKDTDLTKAIVIEWKKDLSPIKEGQLVTLTATSKSRFGGNRQPISRTESFKVVYENPCLVKGLVKIEKV